MKETLFFFTDNKAIESFPKSLFVDDILKMLNDVVSNPTCQVTAYISPHQEQTS